MEKTRILRNAAGGAVFAALLLSMSTTADAQDDMPLIMTLTTNIYNYQGPTNSFTIYLGSTREEAEVYVESPTASEYVTVNPWNVGQDEEGNNAILATAIPVQVSATNNEVKIYGNPNYIDLIDVHGCYLSSITLAPMINLSVIDVSHNELTEINLSEQTGLASIDLTDNSFNDSAKMIIGTNHPNLEILQVGINNVCDPNLNLKNFPKLQYFSARNNYGLYDVDPTGCPELVSLVLEVTNVSSIDVSQNPKLDVLNLSQTRISSVDLSNNPLLGEFYLNHEGSFNTENDYKVTSINLSKNPALQYLDLGGNNLTSIDLTNNPDLVLLYLQRNHLSSIDLSKQQKLATVNLSNNDFTFANLPIPQNGWDYYYYRSPLPTELKYKTNEPIDFSSSVIRAPFVDADGNKITPVTYAIVMGVPRAQDVYEVSENDWSFKDGVLTFTKAQPDSVYAEFYCDVFPDWPLQTSMFMVKTPEDYDAPSPIMSLTPAASMAGKTISLSIGAGALAQGVSYPGDVVVSCGDFKAELKGVVTGTSLPASPNVSFTMPSSGGTVTLLMPDGFTLTALAIDGVALQSVDLSMAEGLTNLSITNCGLSSIDLAYNGNLTDLNLSNNALTKLDLSGARGDYEKFSLHNINLSHNKIVNITTVSAATIYNLDLSYNNLSRFDLGYYTGLQNLNLSNNQIEGELDFSKVYKIRTAILNNNKINSLTFSTVENDYGDPLENFTLLNVADNNLSLASLPILNLPSLDYIYAPQSKLQILTVGPAVNLSAQNVVVDGKGTNFTWLYSETGQPVSAADISNNGGATVFNETIIGQSLYCEMTNPAFPAFDNNPLTTTPVTVASKPEFLVGSFVTTENGTGEIGFRFYAEGDNAVYVDWRGDGSEYEPYIYEAMGSYPSIYRTGTTYAGAEAKIYSYVPATNISVFALNNTRVSSADLSPMTEVSAVNFHNAGLTDGSLILPPSENLYELILDGNAFETQQFTDLTNISNLNLAGNKYTEFNLAAYPNVRFAQLSNNLISKITFDNPHIFQLDLTNNNLSEIDLNGIAHVQELMLTDNNLTSIDLEPVMSTLRALLLNGNRFNFATLPNIADMPDGVTLYSYSNQKPMEAKCVDYKIDLSTQAQVNGTPTDFYWFLGDLQSEVYYDYNNEMFVGEQLEGPEDSADPEYTIDNGVTTFLYPQTRSVICAMVNAEFPNLILYTTPTKLTDAGIEGIYADDPYVDVYNMSGMVLKRRVLQSESLVGLPTGVYIVGNQKVFKK